MSRQRNKRKKRVNIGGVVGTVLLIIFIICVIGAAVTIGYIRMQDENVITHVTIECGEPIRKESFFKSKLMFVDSAEFSFDISTIDTSIPQEIDFYITVYKQTFPVKLTIADTLAPTCTVVPQHMFANESIPAAEECVTDVYDIQQPVLIEYMTEPDLNSSNTSVVYCKLEDQSGNINIVEVPFYITKDITAPVITGTHDLQIYVGDTIAYRNGVEVTDDLDENPILEIDNSQVRMDTPGFYTVTYVATDAAGNTSTADITLELVAKPSTYVEPEDVYTAARNVLNSITSESMTDMQKALKIFRWTRYNVHYISSADTTSWSRAAYDGLTKHQGTCYTFAMVAKALLDVAGIENQIVQREPYRNKHYWNLIKIDGEWYHCDSTPRLRYNSYIFMYTDQELANFFAGGWNGYSFDHSKHPASATTSVQSRINYTTGTVR